MKTAWTLHWDLPELRFIADVRSGKKTIRETRIFSGPTDQLSAFLRQHSMIGASVVVTLPARLLFLKRGALHDAPQRVFPLPLENLEWGSRIVAAGIESHQLFAGARKEVINEILSVLTRAGLRVRGFGTELEDLPLTAADPVSVWIGSSQRLERFTRPMLSVLLAASVLILAGSNLALERRRGELAALERRDSKRAEQPLPDRSLDLFHAVSASLPSSCRLTDMTYDADKRSLFLRGRARDYPSISGFVSQLATHAMFTSVRSGNMSLTGQGQGRAIHFSVEAAL